MQGIGEGRAHGSEAEEMMAVSGNEIRLSVAGVGLALRAEGVHRAALHEECYRPFLTTAAPVASVDVTTAQANLDESMAQVGPLIALDGQTLSYRIYGGEGYLDAAAGRGWLRSSSAEGLARGILANYLRAAYAMLLFRHGGLLCHAAGMIRHGRGYLFYGHSGSGKSTTSRLSQRRAELLSDDLVAIRAHDGAWRVYGTPFWGDGYDQPPPNVNAPLRALFGLVKDQEVRLEPLPKGMAVADLLASVPVICTQPRLSARLIDLCTDLVSQVPCYRLHFALDDSFWSVIDELA